MQALRHKIGVYCTKKGREIPFQGAVVTTDSRRSVNLYFTNAARPIAAAVRGSQSSVAPSAILVARSPRCGCVSSHTSSPL